MSNDEQLTPQQIQFNEQLTLEKYLNLLPNDDDKRAAIFKYLEQTLETNELIIEDFGRDNDWLNVSNPLSLHNDLRGLIVVIDFFTYCCINCMHILPYLNDIEKRYTVSDGLIVIGVHTPKFNNEKQLANVADAVMRYGINHAIVNDKNGEIWLKMDIHCWPTIVILGPNSELLFTLIGENGVEDFLDLYCHNTIEYFKDKELINVNKLIPFKLLRESSSNNLLHFPGKLSVSPDESMVAISDTGHNRVMISTIKGIILHIIGNGNTGFRDGSFGDAQFCSPQGIAWKNNEILFVADTQNHAIRQINLSLKLVTTIAGNGHQGYDRIGGSINMAQQLNSPWDLCCIDNDKLFIAMSGSHQIWVLALDDNVKILNKTLSMGCCIALAGSGAEENRNNKYPHRAAFAQPSGLTYDKDNQMLYIADSESSSIRRMSIVTGIVEGVIGGDKDPLNLFSFGDCDGIGINAKLQHPIGVAFCSKSQTLFVADSYNHKIKEIDIISRECISIVGTGVSGQKVNCSLLESQMNEPNGLNVYGDGNDMLITDTNNHLIIQLNLEKNFVEEFKLIIVEDQMDSEINNKFNQYLIVNLKEVELTSLNTLKLLPEFKFSDKIKLTEGAKQTMELIIPDESIFFAQQKYLENDGTEQFPPFNISVGQLTCVENDNFTLVVNANLSLCSIETCYCRKISFYIPIKFILNHNNNNNCECERIVTLFYAFD